MQDELIKNAAAPDLAWVYSARVDARVNETVDLGSVALTNAKDLAATLQSEGRSQDAVTIMNLVTLSQAWMQNQK